MLETSKISCLLDYITFYKVSYNDTSKLYHLFRSKSKKSDVTSTVNGCKNSLKNVGTETNLLLLHWDGITDFLTNMIYIQWL
jgi:arginine repressor